MSSIIDDKDLRRTVLDGSSFSAGDVHAHTHRALRNTEMTAQEKRFCAFLRQGMPFAVACNAAGMSVERGKLLAERHEAIASSQQHNFRMRSSEPLVTRDMLTLMLFEERERSATASEGIAAIREMGRLNGLYPDQQQRLAPTRGGVPAHAVTVDGVATTPEMSRNALARKSDAELHELASAKIYNDASDLVQYDKEPAVFDGEDELEDYEDDSN